MQRIYGQIGRIDEFDNCPRVIKHDNGSERQGKGEEKQDDTVVKGSISLEHDNIDNKCHREIKKSQNKIQSFNLLVNINLLLKIEREKID